LPSIFLRWKGRQKEDVAGGPFKEQNKKDTPGDKATACEGRRKDARIYIWGRKKEKRRALPSPTDKVNFFYSHWDQAEWGGVIYFIKKKRELREPSPILRGGYQ